LDDWRARPEEEAEYGKLFGDLGNARVSQAGVSYDGRRFVVLRVVDDRVVAVRRSAGRVEGLMLEAAATVLIAAYCRGEGMFMPGMFGQIGKLVGEKVMWLRRNE
jgi:hypothetical protein